MRLQGRVAIVTGSAQGIGAAFARRLAEEGASVVVADHAAEQAEATAAVLRDADHEAMACALDVSDETATLEMAEAVTARFGRIDILVNNAAMFIAAFPRKPFWELTESDWDRMMAVNVKGPFLCCKAVFPAMRAQGKGKIVNISSSTIFAGSKEFLHYVTSKAAGVGFTRALAREVGEFGINVNTVCPGLTLSEGVARTYDPAYLQPFIERRCLKRQEAPEDLVGTVAFLASDDSDFITGQTICVDGGDMFD